MTLASGDNPERSWQSGLFTTSLALIPVLELYASPVAGLPLSKLVLGFFLVVAVVRRLVQGRTRFVAGASAPLVLVVGLAFGTILASFAIDDLNSDAVVKRLALLLLWALVVLYCVPTLVNLESLVRAVVFVALLATTYLFLQYASVSILHSVLPNVVEFGPMHAANRLYVDTQALQAHYQWFYYRPASFFAEPQYYSDYATLALVLVIFRSNMRQPGPLSAALLLSVGLLLSTSTTAVVMVFLIWAVWLLGSFSRDVARADLTLRMIFGTLAPIAVILVLSRPIMKQVFFEKLSDLQNEARLGGSFDLYLSLEAPGRVLGIGIGNEEELFSGDSNPYLNSVTAVLVGCGAIGALMLVVYWWRLIKLPGTIPRILTGVYIILSVSGSILYADRSLLYLSVILLGLTQIKSSARPSTGRPEDSRHIQKAVR